MLMPTHNARTVLVETSHDDDWYSIECDCGYSSLEHGSMYNTAYLEERDVVCES